MRHATSGILNFLDNASGVEVRSISPPWMTQLYSQHRVSAQPLIPPCSEVSY